MDCICNAIYQLSDQVTTELSPFFAFGRIFNRFNIDTGSSLEIGYTFVAKLPVDDADKFCAWCLDEFEYEGQTVMMAPASGFYTTPGLGKNEVRIAYVLKKEDLAKALVVLAKALEAYPGRVI